MHISPKCSKNDLNLFLSSHQQRNLYLNLFYFLLAKFSLDFYQEFSQYILMVFHIRNNYRNNHFLSVQIIWCFRLYFDLLHPINPEREQTFLNAYIFLNLNLYFYKQLWLDCWNST